MRPGNNANAAERAYHAGGGRTPVSRTPRREVAATPTTVVTAAGGHARERALQDPGLKDYVRCSGTWAQTSARAPLSCPGETNVPGISELC